MAYLNAVGGGGTLLVIARKDQEASRISRPPVRAMHPGRVQITGADREVHRPFLEIVRAASRDLI